MSNMVPFCSASLDCNHKPQHFGPYQKSLPIPAKCCPTSPGHCTSSSKAQVCKRHQRICCCEQSIQLFGSRRPNPPLFSAHISQVVYQRLLLPLAPADIGSSESLHALLSTPSANSHDSPKPAVLARSHTTQLCAVQWRQPTQQLQ